MFLVRHKWGLEVKKFNGGVTKDERCIWVFVGRLI